MRTFVTALGVPVMAEIIPFVPDRDNAREGKKSSSLVIRARGAISFAVQ